MEIGAGGGSAMTTGSVLTLSHNNVGLSSGELLISNHTDSANYTTGKTGNMNSFLGLRNHSGAASVTDNYDLVSIQRTGAKVLGSSGALTNQGSVLYLENNASQTGGTVTSSVIGLEVHQLSTINTGDAVFIDQDDDASIALNIDAENVSADVLAMDGTLLTTGDAMQITVDNTMTTGRALRILGGAAGATEVFNIDEDGNVNMVTDGLLTMGSDTLEFDGTTTDFELSDDLSLTDATPHLQLIDSTASEDDFEWYADASQVYLTNVTDAVELLRWSSTNAFFLRGSAVTYGWPTADGTNGQFLTTNGSGTMTWTTSSGSGDITDVYNCASGDCASIALADTDLLNMSAVSVSTTTEGLILPQHATDCSTAGTAEGQVCWEADANTLYIGNGATVTAIGSGSDTNADKEFVWPAAATFALEPAEAWAPIFKDAGTNLDMVTVDFDQSTDECRTVMFFAPPDITAGGTVTFSVYSYEASAITGDMIWDLRHNAGIAEGVDPDVALTTEASSADTVQGTAGQVTVTTWTETQTNLAWAASDLVVGEFCRDANHASDTLAADAKVIAFAIRIPRS